MNQLTNSSFDNTVLGQIARLNSHQIFQLYGIHVLVHLYTSNVYIILCVFRDKGRCKVISHTHYMTSHGNTIKNVLAEHHSLLLSITVYLSVCERTRVPTF